MMKSSRGNRLSNGWRCPHCGHEIDFRSFRLAPASSTELVCPSHECGKTFPWRKQNKGKLWPEQRAYSVLR